MRCVQDCEPNYNYDVTWECVSECPSNTYLYSYSYFNDCFPCHSSCALCDEWSEYDCLSCSEEYPYYKQDGYCANSCSSFEYAYTLNGALECYRECPEGSLQFIDIDNNSQRICVEECPFHHYFLNCDEINCMPCQQECLTCENKKTCSSCNQNSEYKYFSESTELCVTECTSDEWLNMLDDVMICSINGCPGGSLGFIDP